MRLLPKWLCSPESRPLNDALGLTPVMTPSWHVVYSLMGGVDPALVRAAVQPWFESVGVQPGTGEVPPRASSGSDRASFARPSDAGKPVRAQ